MDKFVFENVKDFNPDQIFDCGQCFRWEKQKDGSYIGTALGVIARISYIPSKPEREICEGCGSMNLEVCDSMTLEGCGGTVVVEELCGGENSGHNEKRQQWYHYLDLDRNYGEIKRILSSNDDVLSEAIKYGEGIRILNQQPWETLLSFIISQNNNIPRIKKCINGLCEAFGNYIGEYDGTAYYDIPEPAALAKLTEEDLAPVRLGYRAKYIIETAKAVQADNGRFLQSTRTMSSKEAYDYLIGLCGVGPKVANCIMLFSMEKQDSFPIDVWVRRVMNRLYGIDENDIKEMKRFATHHFGRYGGMAQQYLFYYMRWIADREEQ